jgi:hypothetical protein
MTANDKAPMSGNDLADQDNQDKGASKNLGHNTTKTAPHQQDQYQLLLYQAFTAPVWATCADCGKRCGSVDYAFFIRPDGTYCSAYLCGPCADSYRQEGKP